MNFLIIDPWDEMSEQSLADLVAVVNKSAEEHDEIVRILTPVAPSEKIKRLLSEHVIYEFVALDFVAVPGDGTPVAVPGGNSESTVLTTKMGSTVFFRVG